MRKFEWLVGAGQALASAATRVRMIASTTPLNLRAELSRLEELWARGEADAPRFAYAEPPDHDDLRRALGELGAWLAGEGPLGEIYAGRARELCEEAAISAAAGTPRLWALSRQRFRARDAFDAEADAMVEAWLAEDAPPGEPASMRVRSDDEESPFSLVTRLRQEIGARRVPFRVMVVRDLSPLAATGEGIVQVAAGRWMSRHDVERTVLHEIEGHVMPRCRAGTLPLGIFAVGTRGGADDQEGRALWLEHAAGALDAGRRRELSLRHRAARLLEAGADFVETGRSLLALGASLADALRITARVHRGGGLGREVVYLPALLRVTAALRDDPSLDEVLGAGRVAVDAADVLRPFTR
jgi:hypothetical protein